MYAISLLGTVGSIERRGRQLLEMRTFNPAETDTLLSEVATALIDLAELLRVSAPFPLVRHDEKTEAVVHQLLEGQYDQSPMSSDELNDETLSVVKRAAGVEFEDSWLLIPLDVSGRHGENWDSVLRLMQSRVSEILRDFKRILQRLRASDSERWLGEACDCVLEMLESLEDALHQIVATAGYVTDRTDHDQKELLEVVEWKIAALTGDTDA